MTSIINASSSSGVVTTADNSGALVLQTNGVTALTIDSSQNVSVSKFFASSGSISNVSGSNPNMSVGNATNATNAINSINATNATNAINATYATYATNATNATNSINATNATRADLAQALADGGGTSPMLFSYNGNTSSPAYVWGTMGLDLLQNELYLVSRIVKGLGFGGTNWSPTGAYEYGAVYTNSNTYPIALSFLVSTSYGSGAVTVYVDGQSIGSSASNNGGQQSNIFVIVPAGGTWQVVGYSVYGAWILQ